MTEEKLKRAKELDALIIKLKADKGYYSRSVKIAELNLSTYTEDHRETNRIMNTEYVDLDILKTLAVKNIQTQLDKAQKEFDSL